MSYLEVDYLTFVPGLLVKSLENAEIEKEAIYVFSKRIFNKIYKRKKYHIGWIIFEKKAKRWTFVPAEKNAYYGKTLIYISYFLMRLDSKKVKVDFEKGEFESL